MQDNIEFRMRDNLLIKGTLMGNINSPDLIIMLHSGGYDRTEHGVREVTKSSSGTIKSYYNKRGNYEYLSDLLKKDAAILLIDQRNHGRSGKNIDEVRMKEEIRKIDASMSEQTISLIFECLKSNNTEKLSFITNNELKNLIKHPIIKDLSFLEMKDDLREIVQSMIYQNHYANIHLVGTCMGGLVSSLYATQNPDKVKSLTLFSPLFTFGSTFLHPDNEFAEKKAQIIYAGKQFRMGKAVEGIKTYEEIAYIRQFFYENLFALNIPIFCIQGVEDKLVPVKGQEKIFQQLKNYQDTFGLSPVYYAEISPGVHCLYDTIFPSLVEVSEFINSNLQQNDLKRN